ncbi:uncharacterized protein LTHEOB_2097 [Neofusicoccum parvum]|nr:uncharacterized protein LTHEOB_2097 [Neofusicoccum parvum]
MELSSSPPAVDRTSTPLPHSGVREHSDWQEDIEGDLDRALARLANLARDEHEQDPSMSAEQHYGSRLDAAIWRQSMHYTVLRQAWSDRSTALIQRNELRNVLKEVLQKKPDAEQKAAEVLNKLENEE